MGCALGSNVGTTDGAILGTSVGVAVAATVPGLGVCRGLGFIVG